MKIMALAFIMVATVYLYVAMAAAISRDIDEDVPNHIQKHRIPIANFIYKGARICAAIFTCLIMYPIFWV